jgi:hypothetical protein
LEPVNPIFTTKYADEIQYQQVTDPIGDHPLGQVQPQSHLGVVDISQTLPVDVEGKEAVDLLGGEHTGVARAGHQHGCLLAVGA